MTKGLQLLAASHQFPPAVWCAPFVLMLLCVALLPLIPKTSHWWERNRNKLILGLVLGALTLYHYASRGFGTPIHDPLISTLMQKAGMAHDTGGHVVSGAGAAALVGALGNTAMEYIPFLTLLFTLYTICGGITVRGDIPAHPRTNTAFLAIGGLLASIFGTTGASMLLIRPLLQTNSERKHVAHTVVFFIFIVSNIGGCLLPIGDPPLFLGYLRGVPFFWTLALWREWAFMLAALLFIYYLWDSAAYRKEPPQAIVKDESQIQAIRILGKINFLWLAAVIVCIVVLDPNKSIPWTHFTPPPFLREIVVLAIVAISWFTTPAGLRHAAKFNFTAIAEVAALFIGIFLTMQIPVEILNARGAELGLTRPWQFFWTTGALSSFLDNAPTYIVFFETANAMTHAQGPGIFRLFGGDFIRQDLLVAISLGAVFMGANTYIGNGPNFMVKTIAEQHGVKMPSFFGYMVFSGLILIPLFILTTLIFIH